jgi:hypothetical protein
LGGLPGVLGGYDENQSHCEDDPKGGYENELVYSRAICGLVFYCIHGGSPIWANLRLLRGTSPFLFSKSQGLCYLIEPGRVHYARGADCLSEFCLGYTSIFAEHIEPGVKLLAQIAAELNA